MPEKPIDSRLSDSESDRLAGGGVGGYPELEITGLDNIFIVDVPEGEGGDRKREIHDL